MSLHTGQVPQLNTHRNTREAFAKTTQHHDQQHSSGQLLLCCGCTCLAPSSFHVVDVHFFCQLESFHVPNCERDRYARYDLQPALVAALSKA